MGTISRTVRFFRYKSISLLSAIGCVVSVSLLTPLPASAACTPLPTTLGTTTLTVSVPSSGTYRFWAHIYSPSNGNDAFYMQVDQTNCQMTVGNTGISAGQFKWVDYQNGSATNKINLSLSAGSHTFTFAGLDPSVGIDKIILAVDAACVPSGDGVNCTTTSSDTGPIVTPPSSGGNSNPNTPPAVTGTISLPGAANGSAVQYYINGKLVEGTSLDTTKLADGKYTLKRVEIDASGKTTEVTQEITVNNHTTFAERLAKFAHSPLAWAGVALLTMAGLAFAMWRLKPGWFAAAKMVIQSKILRRQTANVQPGVQATVVYVSPGSQKRSWLKVLFAVGFAIVGAATLVYSFAATSSVGYLVWNGSVSNGASIVTKADAIGGKMVQFAASAPAPPPEAPPPTPPPASTTCAPYPAVPDAACTGPTGTLTTYTGSTDFRTPGQVIENVVIHTSGIYVGANNITFRNVKVVYTGGLDANFTIFNIPSGVTGTKFENCEIDGQNKVARAIKGIGSVTVRNCEIHHTANAVEVGTNFTVEDSYIHDIFTPNGMDWHADGIQSAETVSNITVRHNTILLTGNETGAINIIGGTKDTISNVLIEHNLMAGGGYTVYAGAGTVSNYKVINNRFSTRYYPKVGYWNIWYGTFLNGVTVSGNVIHETGAPADSNR